MNDFVASSRRRERVYKPRTAIESTPARFSFTLPIWLASRLLKHVGKPAEIHPAIEKALLAWAYGSTSHRLVFSRVGEDGLPGATEARAFKNILRTMLPMARAFKNGSADSALRERINCLIKWLKIDIVTVIGDLEEKS